MWAPRLRELAGVLLVGDGVVKLLDPRRHDRLWLDGPELWRQAMRPLVESPLRSRCLGAAMVAAGLWLASRQRVPGSPETAPLRGSGLAGTMDDRRKETP